MSVMHANNGHYEHDHGEEGTHDHGHEPKGRVGSETGGRDLLIALSITVLMMIAEAVGGILSNSLALLSDAGHMLTDNLALLLSFFAVKFSTMPATERKTFGFYRLEILAALLNGIILVVISIYIMYEAYLRMMHPQPVQGGLMLIVATIGLIANIIGAFFLFKHSHSSLNIRGAYLHILGDALSSVGVVIGGTIIIYAGWYLIDPILSILISLVIIYGSWNIVTESVNILLEAVPSHINIQTVAAEMAKVSGVREAYHIHVWTITSGVYAMSAHVLVDDQMVSGSRNISDEIRDLLSKKFNILHSTIQLECERCDTATICSLPNTSRYNH
jgi:cobalt-zinc-cadmium efflux system protein